MRLTRMGCRLVLPALAALVLVVAPFGLSVDGPVVAKAYAGKGGGGNGGGSGGGNGGGGNGGGSGGGNGGGGNGGSGGGNNGNGNGNGNGGSNGNGNTSGNSSGDSNSGATSSSASTDDVDNHINAMTGDKVEVDRRSIQVTHRNGMKERIENGRFRMEDKFGRVIVDRKATMADLNRLKSL